MIKSRKEENEKTSVRREGEIADDISVIPLAIPFISGPGSIATVMILTSEAPSIYHTVIVFFAVLITTICIKIVVIVMLLEEMRNKNQPLLTLIFKEGDYVFKLRRFAKIH